MGFFVRHCGDEDGDDPDSPFKAYVYARIGWCSEPLLCGTYYTREEATRAVVDFTNCCNGTILTDFEWRTIEERLQALTRPRTPRPTTETDTSDVD